MSREGERPTRRRAFDWWFRDRRTGRVVIGLWPNPALWVWGSSAVVRAVADLPAAAEATAAGIGTGALLVWGADELARGANPFRRSLGAAALAWQLAGLLS